MRNSVHISKTEYHVDRENKVVLCTLYVDTQLSKHPAWVSISQDFFAKRFPFISYGGEFIVKAKARCNKEDEFDEVIGKRIAESRAKTKAYRTAYKFWSICAKNIGNMVKFCNSTASACSVAFCKEEDHVKKLCK